MNDCCKETYRKTLEDVLLFIIKMPGKSMAELISTLKYAIKMLEKLDKPKEEIKISLNELVNK